MGEVIDLSKYFDKRQYTPLNAELEVLTKHLPGKHDQRTHTPHMYRGRGATFERKGDPAALETAYDQLGLSEDDLAKMFWVPGADKYKIWVRAAESKMEPGTHDLLVTCQWNAGPARIGVAVRKFHTRDGRRVAKNESLGIDHTGQGLGSILYANQIRMLRQKGYHKITLEANDAIGRYAWARKGFNYDSSNRQELLTATNDGFRDWARNLGYGGDELGGWPTFTSAKEVADYDPGQRTWVKGSQISNDMVEFDARMHMGKAYMLDHGDRGHGDWSGELVLNE